MDEAPSGGKGADEHERVDYDKAKLLFLSRIPQARNEPHTDEWVTLLAEVGRYALDRWSAENKAISTGSRPSAVKKAINELNSRDFNTLAAEAREALAACRRRHSDQISANTLEAIEKSVKAAIPKERVGIVRWHGIELYKGFLAFIALVILSVLISLMGKPAKTAIHHDVDLIAGPPEAPNPPAASSTAH